IGAEVGARVGEHVIKPAADQAARHRPHGDVEHRALLAAARDPAPIAPQYRDEDADEDEHRKGTQREPADVPDALRGAGDRGQQLGAGPGHRRTPAASSAVSFATSAGPLSTFDTSAEPTITASA